MSSRLPDGASGPVAIHSLDPEDAVITAAMRSMLSSGKGARPGVEARGQFDAIMEKVLPREDVTFEANTLGGIPGLWVHPPHWRSSEAILHLHGGWFNFGSAKAYRHLVGQIAARAGARAFIPDYRLAPEHPFPAATDDVLACCKGLADRAFIGLLLPETPPESAPMRLLSKLLCCRQLPTNSLRCEL